mgnify:FL=1
MQFSNVDRFIRLQRDPTERERHFRKIYDFLTRERPEYNGYPGSLDSFKRYLDRFLVREQDEVAGIEGPLSFPDSWIYRSSGSLPLMISGFEKVKDALESGQLLFRPRIREAGEKDLADSYPDPRKAKEAYVLEYEGEISGCLELHEGIEFSYSGEEMLGDNRLQGNVRFDTIFRHYDTLRDTSGERILDMLEFLVEENLEFAYDPLQDKGVPIVHHLYR